MAEALNTAVAQLAGIYQTARMLRAQVEGAIEFQDRIDNVGSLNDCSDLEEQIELITAILGEDSKTAKELHAAEWRLKERSGLLRTRSS